MMGTTEIQEDHRLQFFMACSKALAAAEVDAHSVEARRRLEEESTALFFKVAAVFHHPAFFREQLNTVLAALTSMKHTLSPPPAPSLSAPGGEEAHYYELLMHMYEDFGCAWAASRFALAAARHINQRLYTQGETNNNQEAVVVEEEEDDVRRSGRLWSSVFDFCLRAGDYDEAFAALLGNDVAEQQVDCVHRLVKELCDKGEIGVLCSLPFANNSLVVHAAGATWISLLDEAVNTLRRRAASADLDTRPQPYKVLFDFHVARGNFQSAAGAMLGYARRIMAERPGEGAACEDAQHAFGAAVGALSLVSKDQAWIEESVSSHGAAASYMHMVPRIVTLENLKKEYAVARARAAQATVRPGGQELFAAGPDETFNHLLSLGTYCINV